jgi:hypothetical protein
MMRLASTTSGEQAVDRRFYCLKKFAVIVLQWAYQLLLDGLPASHLPRQGVSRGTYEEGLWCLCMTVLYVALPLHYITALDSCWKAVKPLAAYKQYVA